MNLPELRQAKAEKINAAQEIANLIKSDGRADFRPDEAKRFDDLHAEAEALQQTISRLERQEAAEASLNETQGRRSEPNPIERPSPREIRHSLNTGRITERDRSEALRAWMLGGQSDTSPETRELARRCGMPLESKTINIPLFAPKALRTTEGMRDGYRTGAHDLEEWRSAIDEERAALTGVQSTTTTGGYTVPDEAMKSLEVALLAFGGMRQTSTIIRTATGGPLPIPTVNDTANKGAIIAENVTMTELEMTFGQVVLDSWKYTSKYILASLEFLRDTSIDAAAFLGQALGDRIGRIQNDNFTTGSGSAPNGIVTAATSSAITTAASAVITYDNLVDVEHTIDPAYRVNGRWMMCDAALKIIKKIKALQYSGDTTGVPLWMPSMASGQPDTILGYPYIINQSVATIGAGSKSVLFGDLSKYLIRDVRGVEVRRLDELYAMLGQVAFLAFAWADGDLLDAGTNPVKYMIQGS